jgi:hypothetical protein
MNWIERKAASEKHLANYAIDTWDAAMTAIDNCLKSFKEHYGQLATVSQEIENGHRLTLTIKFGEPSLPLRKVVIAFNEDKQEIVVIVDGNLPAWYAIKSDENHAFIVWRDKEISADGFSELALRAALFVPPIPKKPSSGQPISTAIECS